MRPFRSPVPALLAAAVAVGVAVGVTGCGDPAPGAPQDPRPAKLESLLRPVDRVAHPELNEGSGLVRWNGAWWMEEDSRAQPVLWRSETLDFAQARPYPVEGAVNVDWEDVTTDGDDLLVADLGDNLRGRTDATIYRVRAAEPGAGPGSLSLRAVAKYPVAWPDGPHDCEAVAVIDGKLHAVVKDRGEGTILFRFDELRDAAELRAGKRNVPKEVARLELGDREQVTSAVFDETSRSLVLLTYTQLARYPADRMRGAPADATWIGARQSESLALDGEDLVFANEQRDVFRVERFRDWRFSRLLPPRVKVTLGAEDARLPLADAGDEEELSWRLEGDVLRVRAVFRVAGQPQAADVQKGKTGTGVLLAFGRSDRSHVSGDETLLAATLGPGGAGVVHRVALSDRGLVLAPEPRASAKVRMDGERVIVEAGIELAAAFGRGAAPPERFLCFIQGVSLGRDPPPHFGAADSWALYRPYLWAEIRGRS